MHNFHIGNQKQLIA